MSLKDELSLTHTLALFLHNTQLLSFHSLFLSLSHTHISFLVSPHTQFHSSVFLFLLFSFHTLTGRCCRRGRPPGVPESGGAYISQGTLLWDCKGCDLGARSPILHFLSFQKGRAGNSLGKKEKKLQDHTNQGQQS